MKAVFFILPFLLLLSSATAQQQWTLPGSGMVQIRAVAEAPNGATYFAGLFTDTLFYGQQQTLVSAGAQDAFIVKRSSMGQIDWAFRFGSDNNDAIWDISCNSAGDVYLAGYASGKLRFRKAAGDTVLMLPAHQSSAYGICLNSQGHFQAAQLLQTATPNGTVIGHAIEASDKGFYLACHHYGEVVTTYTDANGQLQTLHIPGLSQAQESFILQVDSSQQAHLHLQLTGTQGQFIRDLELDDQENLYVTGNFSDANAFDWQNNSAWASPQDSDGFLACYMPNGQLNWLKLQTGAGFNSGTELALDEHSIYLTGIFDQEIQTPQTTYPSIGQEDIFLQAYSSDGQLEWTSALGTAEPDIAVGLALHAKGPAVLFQTEGSIAGHNPWGMSQLLLQEWDEQGQLRDVHAFQSTQGVYGRGVLTSQNDWAVWGLFERSLQGPAGQQSHTAQAGFWHRWPACQTSSDSITRYVCAGDSLLLNGSWFAQSGHYQQQLTNSNGCDSILYIRIESQSLPQTSIQPTGEHLTVQPADSSWTVQWFWNGQSAGTGLQLRPAAVGDYWTLVTDSNGCVYQSSPWMFISPIEHQELNAVPRFFPNPNSGFLYWQPWEKQPEALRLYDNTGRLIRHFRIAAGQQQLYLGDLPNGIYQLSWQEGGRLQSFTLKMQR